jgi:predicted DNA-binding transcriptional regulator YafY
VDRGGSDGLDTAQRLRLRLAMVAYLAQTGGSTPTELAEVFKLPEALVVEELLRAACCGQPPYGPGELLEIIVDKDTVAARLPRRLRRPLRLTALELAQLLHGLAVVAEAASSFAPRVSQAARRLLDRLQLGSELGSVLEAASHPAIEIGELLDKVQQARKEDKWLVLDYRPSSGHVAGEYEVAPLSVSQERGLYYLRGMLRDGLAIRRFRLDRVVSARVGSPRSSGSTLAMDKAFSEGAREAHLRLLPPAYFLLDVLEGAEVVSSDAKSKLVKVPLYSEASLALRLLPAVSSVTIISPLSLREKLRSTAAKMRLLYEELEKVLKHSRGPNSRSLSAGQDTAGSEGRDSIQ